MASSTPYGLATLSLSLVLSLWLSTSVGLADELETLYIIGLPATEANPDLPPDAIVIHREQLAQYGSSSLGSVLQQIPGISINQNGGRGSFNGLFLRGADPNFTQVRIDGVPINNATNTRGGAFDISSINTQIIERIEIISDASSAVYGSQALAGIINIVTRSSSLESAIEFDSHGGEVASAFIAGDNVALSLVRERPGSAVVGSRYASDELGIKANWRWSNQHRLQIVGRVQDYTAEAFPDDSGGSLFATSGKLERRDGDINHLATHYAFQTNNGAILEVNASYFKQIEVRNTPEIEAGLRDSFGLPAIAGNSNYQRKSVEARYTQNLNDSLIWRSGLAWEQETGKQSGQLDFGFFQLPTDFNLQRTSSSLTQSIEFQPNNATKIMITGRFDDNNSGTQFTPRLSASYTFDDKRQIVFTTLGQGFKQASIYALSDPLVGNQLLQNESADSLQVGHRFTGINWQATHTAYHYEFKNLIDFEPGPPPMLVNRDSVKVSGIESTIAYKSSDKWSVDLFQTYNSARVAGSQERLRQRPRYRAGIQLNVTLNDKFDVWTKHLYVSDRLDSSIPTSDVVLDGYSVIDAGLRWHLSSQWQLNAQWKNVFSKSYSNTVGNRVEHDTLLLQLSFRGPKLF